MNQGISTITIQELCLLEGIEREVVFEIVEYGIVAPISDAEDDNLAFNCSSVHWIKKALRLQQDLEIDWVAVAVVIDLLQQQETLRRENEGYRQQLRRLVED